jgi:phosphoribosylaminoimidazole-succinocarboxamide synthase
VREWIIANHFMGKEGQVVPEMSDEWLKTISERYIELFEKVTGEKFQKRDYTDSDHQMKTAIENALISTSIGS